MQIRQLSAAVDVKLRQLDKQLDALNQKQASNTDGSNPQLEQEIEALVQIRHKLVKSRDLAVKAHQLVRDTNEHYRARQRLMGLALCGISLLGGVQDQLGEHASAIRLLRESLPEAVQLRDPAAEAQYRERLGAALQNQGAWPEALSEFDRAMQLLGQTPQSMDSRLNCARLQGRRGWLDFGPCGRRVLSRPPMRTRTCARPRVGAESVKGFVRPRGDDVYEPARDTNPRHAIIDTAERGA